MKGSTHYVCHCFQFEGEWYDMIINYEVTSYIPGFEGSWDEAPYGAEYEFEFISVVHDLPKGAEPEPVPEGLGKMAEEWFESREGYEEACEKADREAWQDD